MRIRQLIELPAPQDADSVAAFWVVGIEVCADPPQPFSLGSVAFFGPDSEPQLCEYVVN